MDKNKLRQLLKKEEGPNLDFKQELRLITESDRKELAKDVIAIANSRGGRGYLVFGIEDKTKRIIGIDPGSFKEEQIQQIINNRSDPPITISVNYVEIEEKLVAVITIFKSSHCPHQMMHIGAFYIRRGSTTDTARRTEIAGMMQENGLMSYETVIVKNASTEDLDFSIINNYLRRLNVVSERPSNVLLAAMGIIGEGDDAHFQSPTIGGLLLFGKNPSIFLPHVYVKVSFRQKNRYFYGNILKMLDDAFLFIKECLKDKKLPINAVEECLANALVHRDYLDNSRGVHVIIKDDTITISNPGALVSGNTVLKYMRENNPERRNPWLYQRLLTLDTKKRFLKSGIGLKRIQNSFSEIGKVKFINIGSKNLFNVVLPFN
mgnify:CR=1 FL=1